MNRLVSIVLPIYNVSAYLDRCMDSVVNQTYKDLEIIMVDDGSTDECSDICEKWKSMDDRIKVIHKKNAGLGYARNTGLENATGEFVFFLDSDDYVKTDLVEKCMAKQLETGADLVLYGFSRVDKEGKEYKEVIPRSEESCFSGDEVRNEVLPALLASRGRRVSGLWMSAWTCMYSKKLMDDANWKFVSEREVIAEDVYSLLKLYASVDKVAILPEKMYYYCDNNASLTHMYREDRISRIDSFLKRSMAVVDELKYGEKIRNCLYSVYASFMIGALKTVVMNPSLSYLQKRKIISKCRISKDCARAMLKGKNRKRAIMRGVMFYSLRFKLLDIAYLMILLRSNHI